MQNVDKAYEIIAEQFNKGTLEGGDHYYDLNTGVVEMGTFSPLVDQDFQQRIAKLIKTYNKTGELPKTSNGVTSHAARKIT